VAVVELVEGTPYPGMCGNTVVFESVHDDTEQIAVVSHVAELMHEGGDLGQPAGSHLQGCGTRHGVEHPGLQPGPHTLGRQAEDPGRGGHRNTGDFGETALTDLGEAVAHGGTYRVVGQGGVEVFDVGHGVLSHGGAEGGSHQPILTHRLAVFQPFWQAVASSMIRGFPSLARPVVLTGVAHSGRGEVHE